MTDYRFTKVLVWDNVGGNVRPARNQRVDVTDPTTGAVAADLKVSGQPVSFLTSDSSGHVDFTSTQGIVRLTSQSGFWQDFESPDLRSNAVQAGVDAQNAAASAASSATSAQNAANLVGAPAGTAIDTYIGGNSSVVTTRQGITMPATISHTDVQAALTSAASAGTRVQAAGSYTTSSTLVITSDCDLSRLTINYTGTGTAVQIGNGTSGSGGILFRKDIRLPVVINTGKTGTGWAAGTVGVRAINTFACSIRVPRVRNFETGYLADSLGTGNVYNDVQLLHLDNNKRNLVLNAGSAGWTNSNTYRLGSLQHDSAEGSVVAGTRQILLAVGTNIINGNLFLGGSVEGNTAEYHLDCDGLYNRFEEIRWENAGGCRVIWQGHSARNVIDYGYNAHQLIETHVAGSSLNRLFSTGTSYMLGSSSKAVNVWENTSSSAAGVDAIMDPGARLAGTDPATGYRVMRTADATKMKRAADAADRLILDHVNGRLYVGSGAAAPTIYFGPVGTTGVGLTGGNLYFSTDNTQDIGLAGSQRPRYVRVGTAVQTGAAATASRPSASTAGAGAMFYDTTLSKPIWSDGTTWKDATGTAV